MTIKSLFSITAILDLLLAATWILFPKALLAWWGTNVVNEMLVYISQRYGVLFLGYAATLWLSRSEPPSKTQRALVVGGFIVAVLMAGMSLKGVLSNTINAWGLIAFTLEALLAIGFSYFLFIKREPTT